MWPFGKSKDDTYLEDGIATFKAFRDIGQSFNYLGLRFIVIRHAESILYPHTIKYYPRLIANYADAHGIIHTMNFNLADLPALKAEND